MNPDWLRWILMSLSKHFFDIITEDNGMNLFIQGAERAQEQTEGAEFSTNGPFFFNPSTNYWIIDIDVNVLVNVFKDDKDIYKVQRFQSKVLKAYTKVIPVYKYESTTLDSAVEGIDIPLLGCLQMFGKRGDDVVVLNFGEIAPDIRVLQSIIAATYRIELTE